MPLSKSDYQMKADTVERAEWKAPYTEEEFCTLLIERLSSNYKEKFGIKHIPQKNVFSVSALVSGPGSAVSQRERTLAGTDPVTGEEAKVFNFPMFRGSAMHHEFELKLPDFHSYGSEKGNTPKLSLREVIPYIWQDGVTNDIIITGHPDGVKDDVLIEIKSISSQEKDPVKRLKYKQNVIKKAKFQGGCYAKMLTREIKRHYFCYVVTLDEDPEKHEIKEEDKKNGFVMINDGKYKLQLNEKMIKKGYVTDSHIRVYLLNEDEMWHGYNYCRWSAREAVKMIEMKESNLVLPEEVPELPVLGKKA